METIIEIRKNQIFKKIAFMAMEIRQNPIFKTNLFRLMETDFRASFLLVETIIEIRQNSVFKKYSSKGKLIHGRGNGFSD